MSYDPLRAPIERARRMEDCDAARRELDAFAHQPEPELHWRDFFPARVRFAIAGLVLLILAAILL